MNLLTEWPPKRDPLLAKRKRKSIESLIREDAPKKPKGAEDGGGQISGSIAAVARARDESGPFPSAPTLHVPSPITPRSLQSPSLHHGNDDRKSPRSPDSSRRFPLSPRSRSPETRLDDGEVVNNTHAPASVRQSSVADTYRRRLSDEPTKPRKLRIDTDRARSDLDLKGVRYQMDSQPAKDTDPQAQTGPVSSNRAIDRTQASRSPQSRRDSENMPPPTSARIKALRSGDSTPMNSASVISKESPTAAHTNSQLTHSNNPANKSIGVHEVTLPRNITSQSEMPIANNFNDFARAIMSTTSANIKIDNVKEKTSRTERVSRRQSKKGFVHDNLNDCTVSLQNTLESSNKRLLRQFATKVESQDSVAAALAVNESPAPVFGMESSSIPDSTTVQKEIESLREELEKVKRDLDYIARKGPKPNDLKKYARYDDLDSYVQFRDLDKYARLSDLEGYANANDLGKYLRKAQHREDIAQLVKKEEVHGIEEKLAAHTLDLKKLEGKMSDLAIVTGERYRECQREGKHSTDRFEGVDNATANLRSKQASLEDRLTKDLADAQERQCSLEKRLENQKNDVAVCMENFESLQNDVTGLKVTLQGVMTDGELSHHKSTDSNFQKLPRASDPVEQRQERTEESQTENKVTHNHQNPSSSLEYASVSTQEIKLLRYDLQDLETSVEDRKNEYSMIVDDIETLSNGMKSYQNESAREIARLNDEVAGVKRTPTNLEDVDRARIDRLETDLRALDTQFVVQKNQFDNLTTEHLAHCIIHQMKQLYKEHPAFVQDKLRLAESQLFKVDHYIGQNLEPRLGTMNNAITINRQALEIKLNDTSAYIRGVRKEFSENLIPVRASIASYRDSMESMIDKARLAEDTMKRLDDLEGAIEDLRREKQARSVSEKSPESFNLINFKENPKGGTHVIKKDTLKPTAQVSGTSSGQAAANGHLSPADVLPGVLSSEESDDQPILSKRKRRTISKISDSESDANHDASRKLARREDG